MKHWIGFSFLMTLISVLTMGSSCRHLASPTFPPTFTFTPTSTIAGTATFTSTKTVTGTFTNTATVTATATLTNTATVTSTPTITNTPGGPTNTFTSTPTVTATFTITNTPTNTATVTSTNTPGSSGPCTVLLNTSAVIDNGTYNGNWDGYVYGSKISTISTSSTGVVTGTTSIDVNVTGATSGYQVVAVLGSFEPTNWTNATQLVMDVTADAALTTSCGTYCQITAQGTVNGNDGSNLTSSSASISPTTQSVTLTLSGITAPANVSRILFIVNSQNPGTGNLYLNNIRLLFGGGVCPPAPAAAVTAWNFDDNTQDGWVTSGANVGGITPSLVSGGFPSASSLYYFNLSTTFTASYQSSMLSQTFTPALDVPDGIRARIWVDSSAGAQAAGQIWPSDGTNTSYNSFVKVQLNSWSLVDFPVASWTYGGVCCVNNAAVESISVGASSGGNTPFGTGNVKIDDIEAY